MKLNLNFFDECIHENKFQIFIHFFFISIQMFQIYLKYYQIICFLLRLNNLEKYLKKLGKMTSNSKKIKLEFINSKFLKYLNNFLFIN